MHYDVAKGFELPRKENRRGNYDKSFWKKVDAEYPGLSGACGCYLFALKNGSNIKTWYVGKAEKQTFSKECFSIAKKYIFDDLLNDRNGTPLIFLIPRLTSSKKFCKTTKNAYRDIGFLEKLLIGIALEENEELLNIKDTSLLRGMHVPGIINRKQAAPSLAVQDLRNALGLKRKR